MADRSAIIFRWGRWICLGIFVVLVCSVGYEIYFVRQKLSQSPHVPQQTSDADDPRLTYDTPYENVRPDVKYVGDAACVGCHQEIAKTYALHPMGRASALTSGRPPAEPLSAKANNPFDKFGNVYSVVMRDNKMFHREERRDAQGKTVTATECEAKFAVGSGTRGKSYLVEFDGRLFQSPISWFSEKQIWDISPGYHSEQSFTRTISPKCMFCHCNQADHIAGTTNSYRDSIFNGLSIGCERCHGPGERHVKLRESGAKVDKSDFTIVNPRQLTPMLRDAVCEQCHLQGEERVLRRGRETFDFRPGMPLQEFSSVFVRPPELTTTYRSVGQAEQLRRGRCHSGSKGELGCISCHDPHYRPEPAKRVEYYRAKCQACHNERGCSMPHGERLQREPNDSCIACHMSKDGSRNIPHTAVTDHRILRRPESGAPPASQGLRAGQLPLVGFHPELSQSHAAERERDLGVALMEISRQGKAQREESAGLAEPLLEAALRRHPNDAEAWSARGFALTSLKRTGPALEAFGRAIELRPNHESALVEAAFVCGSNGRVEEAIGYWKKAITVNPYQPHYHLELARLHAQRREWTQARTASESAIKLLPLNADARMLLVTALARTGETNRAQQEFDTLLKLQPANAADLRRVFESLIR